MPLTKVISGAQSGVDIAALEAAKVCGLETGGWMPKGYLTEDGPRPYYADLYGMREMPTTDYPSRTQKNVEEADATLILVDDLRQADRGGTSLTRDVCIAESIRRGKHWMVLKLDMDGTLGLATTLIREGMPARGVLNVAGPRESKAPGIGGRAKAFLVEVFRLTKESQPTPP